MSSYIRDRDNDHSDNPNDNSPLKAKLLFILTCLLLIGCPIDDDDDASDLDISSDRIIYIADQDIPGNFEIFIYSFSSETSQQLNLPLPLETDILDFAISSDKEWVIFSANYYQLDKTALFAVPSNGGVVYPISPRKKSVHRFWSGSDNEIFFAVEDAPTKTYGYSLKRQTVKEVGAISKATKPKIHHEDLIYILENSSLDKQTVQSWQKYSIIY